MHCTRCGNPISSHTHICPICQYELTEDEYKEGLEEEKKSKNKNNKDKKAKPIKPKIVKPEPVKHETIKPVVTNSVEVTIIDDKTKTYTKSNHPSLTRYIGYLFFLLADFSLVFAIYYLWYLNTTTDFLFSMLFIFLCFAFAALGVYICMSSGVTIEHIRKNSLTNAIIGLIVSLTAFILLMVEMAYNNPILILVSIGLFILGVGSFIISMVLRESYVQNKL